MISSQVIQSNQRKLYFYMFVTTLIIGILGCCISFKFNFGLTGTGVFLIAAGIIDYIAYFYSDVLVLKSEGATPLTEESLPEYFEIVKKLCENNNLKMPRLYMVNSQAINAFATGRNIDKAVLVVTRGMLEKLTPEEISGVVGHELAHIETGDMKLMSILSILSGLVCILSDMFWYSNAVNRASERDNSGILQIFGLILALFAPITSLLIKLSVSRTREYSADARGAEISGNPQYLAVALNKIKHDRIKVPHASKATAHLYFASPFNGDFIDELFSTHPNIDERIKKLLSMELK